MSNNLEQQVRDLQHQVHGLDAQLAAMEAKCDGLVAAIRHALHTADDSATRYTLTKAITKAKAGSINE
jgi:hypothetical protein